MGLIGSSQVLCTRFCKLALCWRRCILSTFLMNGIESQIVCLIGLRNMVMFGKLRVGSIFPRITGSTCIRSLLRLWIVMMLDDLWLGLLFSSGALWL